MAKGPSVVLLAQFVLTIFLPSSWAVDYPVDDSTGLGRKFDGIGGLSGGGVSMLGSYLNRHAHSGHWW